MTKHAASSGKTAPSPKDVLPPGSEAVRAALIDACRATGAPLTWMVVTGGVESCFKVDAQNKSSTARGLFQFTEQSWYAALMAYGEKHGLDSITDHLRPGKNGGFTTKVKNDRSVLALRDDPRLNALMAAEMAQENRAALKGALRREPTHSELYLAHFLGASDATAFLKCKAQRPDAPAAELFPRAAASNGPVFYHVDGTPKSLKEIDGHFAQRFKRADALVQQIFPHGVNPPSALAALPPPPPKPAPRIAEASTTPESGLDSFLSTLTDRLGLFRKDVAARAPAPAGDLTLSHLG